MFEIGWYSCNVLVVLVTIANDDGFNEWCHYVCICSANLIIQELEIIMK